jgi:hypothetical protein
MVCFFAFFHTDILAHGWYSVNFLFGKPLEFYENVKRIQGQGEAALATYPPTLYALFALWLYPAKLMRIIPDPQTFSVYLTYWLKALTALVYVGSAAVFYQVASECDSNRGWAKLATIAWLTTPLAFFSEFIFSQVDIFYVFLTLVGLLMCFRQKLYSAALAFGVAITFKYFPLFVFIPLILFLEKRATRLIVILLIFATPTVIVNVLYGESQAFVDGVRHYSVLDRIYSASHDIGGYRIYWLFAAFTVLCGAAYCMSEDPKMRKPTLAYLWLVASVFSLSFVMWHPHWVLLLTPPIALTTMMSSNAKRLLFLDILGMFFFVAAISLVFQNNADATMFEGDLFGIPFGNDYLISKLFAWFGGRSGEVFLSCFWGYLLTNVLLKYKLLRSRDSGIREEETVSYADIRRRFWVGLLLFLGPATFAIYKDLSRNVVSVANGYSRIDMPDSRFGELLDNRKFEQRLVAGGTAIENVTLLLSTFDRADSGQISLSILDATGHAVAEQHELVRNVMPNDWHEFSFNGPVFVHKGDTYVLSLTSSGATLGNAITWLATDRADGTEGGAATGEVASGRSAFAFRVDFRR